MKTIVTVFVLLAVPAAIAAVILINELRGQRRREAWRALAEATGLEYAKPDNGLGWRAPGALDGQRGGARITVTSKESTLAVVDGMWTVVTLRHPLPLGVGLEAAPRGLLSHMGARLRGHPVRVGDASFDAGFLVCVSDMDAQEETLRALTPDARRAMTALARHQGALHINDAWIRLVSPGLRNDAAWLEAWLEDAQAVSRALVHAAHQETSHVRVDADARARG